MEKVSVNKGVLVGVVAVAAGSLLAVAFLLGRASGPSTSPVPPVGAPARDFDRFPRRPGAQAPDPPFPTPAPAGLSVAPFADASSPPMPPRPPRSPATHSGRPHVRRRSRAEPSGARSDPDPAAVAAYLDAVDRVQPGATGGSPEGIANELAAALANGDTSGLDGLIRETEGAKERLGALRPPAACAAHHRESLGSLDDALEVLRSLKTAMESPDPAAGLASVAAQAGALRSRAEALQREETTLRERYGLKR